MFEETERRKKLLQNRLTHWLHPMNLYCRLYSSCGESFAKSVCIWYETHIWKCIKLIIKNLPKRGEV